MSRKPFLAAVAAGALIGALLGAPSAGWSAEVGTFGLDMTGMDRSVRPGDDMWEYMNGGWAKTAVIPADRPTWGDVARLRELSLTRVRGLLEAAGTSPKTADARKYGDLYATYMDEAAIEAKGAAPLRPVLARVARVTTPRDIAVAVAELQRVGTNAPVSPEFDVDLKTPTAYAALINQGGLGMPDREYYLSDDPKMADARKAYRTYLVTLFRLAGMTEGETRADRIMAFETELAKAHWTRVQSRDRDKTYNPMTPAELAAAAPGFDWPVFLKTAGLDGRKTLIVSQPSSMTGFARLAAATPIETWRDYLSARAISAASPLLSKAFVDANFDYVGKALSGTPQLTDRWKRAVGQVNAALGDAVGQEYSARYFPPAAKAKIEAMIAELKVGMARRIDGLDWMQPATKVRAKTKLANLKIEVGYPDEWRDYSALKITRGDLYGSVRAANAFEYNRQLAKLGKPVDRGEWDASATPQTVNAFNYGALLKLQFPAGFLAAPYFDPDADPAVNYGAIGYVIGHEISHSFDDQGAKLDDKGRLINWWTPEDVKAFEASTGRLATQYDAYEPLPGVHLQGRLTLGENVGDLGGLAAALEAYHISLGGKPAPVIDGLTGDQRFFLSYAQAHRSVMRDAFLRQIIATDPHSPDRYRTYNVRNLDDWYAAFEVRPGDKLYVAPADRVRIW